MRKKIFYILSCFLILFFFFFCNFQKNYSQDILSILNGKSIEVSLFNKKMSNWSIEYLSVNFDKDDIEIVMLDNVKSFKEFVDKREEINNLVKENPELGFTLFNETFNEFDPFYNSIEQEYDKRVIERDNKYLIKRNDLLFKEDTECILYGHFQKWFFKEDYPKKTLSQAQQDMSVEYVDKYKEDGKTIYVYFDTDTNKTIKVAVKTILGFVISCETVY